MSKLSVLLAVCVLVMSADRLGLTVEATEAAKEITINAKMPWMYYLPYGENVELKPLFQNTTDVPEITSCRWVLPNNDHMTPDDPYSMKSTRYRLHSENCTLTVLDNQRDTNGIYHCVVNDQYVSKAMLNVFGAPILDKLVKYKPNLIAGFSAFGSIVAAFIFFGAVLHFRYKAPIIVHQHQVQSYENNGFEMNNADDSIAQIKADPNGKLTSTMRF